MKRFNAYSYVRLSEAMDSHNVARERAYSIETVLSDIEIPTLVISVSSDVLFPINEQQLLAKGIKNSVYKEIDSLYGHDGFLIETKQLTEHIKKFYQSKNIKTQKVTI